MNVTRRQRRSHVHGLSRFVLFALLALFWTAAIPVAGCAQSIPDHSPTPPARDILVFAASSLTDALTDAAARFESIHPDTEIVLNFGGSQQLAQQLAQGAPADIFASANRQQVDVAVAADRIAASEIVPLATNRLVIVTPADNPAGVESPVHLARRGIKLVVAAPQVPAGRYTELALERAETLPADDGYGPGFAAAVTENVVSYEQNVRAVLSKVQLGEADAGIVYASDVAAAAAAAAVPLQIVELPDQMNVTAAYFVAPVADAANPAGAATFLDFLLSDEGQVRLESYGFGPADAALRD